MAEIEGAGRRSGPTLRDVAKRAQVSVATASRALASDYPVAEPTRAKVLQAVEELNYVVTSRTPRRAAPTGTIAMVVSDVVSPLRSLVATGVAEAAQDYGRLSAIYITGRELRREEEVFARLEETEDVEAVILVGGVEQTDEYEQRMASHARALHARGSQLVLCGRPPLAPGVPALVVEYDNRGGAYAATSHLLSMGHRRVLTLTGPERSTTTIGRVEGYRQALQDFGTALDPALVIPGTADRSGAYQGCLRALGDNLEFTAIFAHNDVMASGALAALREKGLSVPEDISLVGYDNIPVAQELSPPLTTVYMPHEELGKAAVRLAVERPAPGSGRERQLLGTHIVIRSSVRPLSSGS
ncbi:LacI family DNA-binding transcriptional regulator [Streptomyces sp. SID13031]|uniref:LacI family DNA-binding transcriptional regulator n=1 Tax=Streptomyces sp. SID13031 TaxID=2706046 RepID=UPI0013CB6D46|nr:LacI family DNA-binding transcriptional regulator [Streptomyces sp. SID13031]NEA33317.1 LacI family transcriptional regulator [Streptomyces sp. SID13031]